MSSNIALQINRGDGLSYAIDRALDAELNQDITLSKVSQWQSIFNIITDNEQAEQTQANQKQFTSKDKDVKNYKHYGVNEGTYNLTQSTWNKIVDYVKKELKLEQPEVIEQQTQAITQDIQEDTLPEQALSAVNPAEQTEQAEQLQAQSKTEELKAELLQILPDFENEQEALKEDLIGKYNTMIAVAQANNQTLDREETKTRLENYIKGWKYHNFETTSSQNDVFNEGISFQSYEEMKDAYLQFGKESAELYDKDNNGADIYEIFYQKVKDHYIKQGWSNNQATLKALEMTETFNNNIPDENNPLYTSDEMNIFTDIMREITVKDRDGDERLSAEEYAIDRMATAQSIDNKNSVMHEESYLSQMAVRTAGLTEEEIMEELNVSQENAHEIFENNKMYYQKYNMAAEFLTGDKIDIEQMFG